MTRRAPFDLYIASCERDGGIYQYKVFEDFSHKLVSFTPMDRPMYMVNEAERIYAILRAPFDSTDSGLVVCEIGEDSALSVSSAPVPTLGEVAAHLAVDNGNVYIANYISGNLVKMPDTVVAHSGRGSHPSRQTSPHTHYVSLTPDGKYVCVCDLGIDKIIVYDKELGFVSEARLPSGHGPRHLAFHSDKTHVFCTNELESTVTVLTYKDGVLTPKQTVYVLPSEFEGESATAAIRCEKDVVYVSNRGHDSVSVLDFSGDRLTMRKTISTMGKCPRDFIVKDGLIIAANELSHTVTLINAETGELVTKISVKSPQCVLAID